MDRGDDRRGRPSRVRGPGGGAARQGRGRSTRSSGFVQLDVQLHAAAVIDVPGAHGGHRRHRRRPRAHREHISTMSADRREGRRGRPRWSSTATAPRPPPPEQRTSWSASESAWTSRRKQSRRSRRRWASPSASPRSSTPRCAHAGSPRKELGDPDLLQPAGPLTNPARPRASAVGVFDERMADRGRRVRRRGVEALVFRGDDDWTRISVATTTTVIWTAATGGRSTREVFDPRDVGIEYSPRLPPCTRRRPGVQRGRGPPHAHAASRGAVRDAVLLSSAAALAALERSARRAGDGTAGRRAWPRPPRPAMIRGPRSRAGEVGRGVGAAGAGG